MSSSPEQNECNVVGVKKGGNSEVSSGCPLVPSVAPVRKMGSENPECVHRLLFSYIVPEWNVLRCSLIDQILFF